MSHLTINQTKYCSSQPPSFDWLSSPIFPRLFVPPWWHLLLFLSPSSLTSLSFSFGPFFSRNELKWQNNWPNPFFATMTPFPPLLRGQTMLATQIFEAMVWNSQKITQPSLAGGCGGSRIKVQSRGLSRTICSCFSCYSIWARFNRVVR